MDFFVPITAQANPAPGGGFLGLVPIVFMFGIFYVLLIRPQMRRQRAHDELVKNLRPKDKIITNSGMHGTIVKVNDNDIVVEVADKVHLRFQRSAVGSVRDRHDDGGG